MSRTAIVYVRLGDPSRCALFQGILEGEDHLGILRGCENGVQELWCSADALAEVAAWVRSLPPAIEARIERVEPCAEG